MIDLLYNLFGSLIAAGLGWIYLKVTPRAERRQLAESIAAAMAPLYSGDMPESEADARAPDKDDTPPPKSPTSTSGDRTL